MPKNDQDNIIITGNTSISSCIIEEEGQNYIIINEPVVTMIPVPFDSIEAAVHFRDKIFRPAFSEVVNKHGKISFRKACCLTVRQIIQGA